MKPSNHLALSTSPQLQPARKPRCFTSLALRHHSLFGRTRRCFTGKELDAETGLYYYGARYLDPKTSRWLSGDPALAEYVPSAPMNDEARKRNGNLPGMGGVFNYVNLHVYHYAGNNPVKYVDPDGKESGYVRNKDSVRGMGHAGVFAKNSNGQYVFTEIIRINTSLPEYKPDSITRDENINTGAFPISLFNGEAIGAVQYTFDNNEQMSAFFKKVGFDDYIRFDTTPEQDAAIIATATQLGGDYTNYMVPGNHCGNFAEAALDAGGKGIKTLTNSRNIGTVGAISQLAFGNKMLGLSLGVLLQSPNAIGDQLKLLNNGSLVKVE